MYSNLTIKDKKDIVFRYIILGQKLTQIRMDYMQFCYNTFIKHVVKILSEENIVNYICSEMQRTQGYSRYGYARLGQKNEPYYQSEDEMFFQIARYKDLSISEKLIYDRGQKKYENQFQSGNVE